MNHSDSNPPPLTTGPLQALHVVGGRASLLLNYRFLIYNLVVRDLKSRYRNSVLGFLWSLLNPLGMMAVFTVISLVLFRDQTIENYPIFLLSGILAWNYFSSSMMTGTNSVVANGHLIKKVHFPTEVLPIATILANLVNFLLALLLLFAAIVILRIDFSPWIWLLPAVILIQTMFTLGIVFFLSTLQVYYHDTLIVMDVVMLAWFFLTPVFYSANMSLGVAALRKAMQVFNYLSDFDFQIVEFHHNQKKDNPSGTALMLQKALPKSSKSKQPVGVRGGGIFGIHNVYAMSESEIIEFSHTALNRQVFAKGAVKVAKWLHEQKPGRLYTFEDYF